MSILFEVFTIVAPVFLLIGIGYGFARTGYLGSTMGEYLGNFVYCVSVPMLIFRTLVNVDLSAGLPFALWGSYFSGVLFAWLLGTAVIRRVFGRDSRASAIGGISASFANTVLVGLPVIAAVYGDAGLVPLLLIISVHLASMTLAMAIVMERAAAVDAGTASPPILDLIKKAGISLIKNPLVIAIVLSFFWRTSGLTLPAVADNVLERIGATALPLGLISLGMSLVLYGVRGNVVPGLVLGFIKLAVMPAVVFCAAAFVFKLPALWIAVATLTATGPTGINAFIFANRFGTGHAMSANAITATTLFAVLTTSLWVVFLSKYLGI